MQIVFHYRHSMYEPLVHKTIDVWFKFQYSPRVICVYIYSVFCYMFQPKPPHPLQPSFLIPSLDQLGFARGRVVFFLVKNLLQQPPDGPPGHFGNHINLSAPNCLPSLSLLVRVYIICWPFNECKIDWHFWTHNVIKLKEKYQRFIFWKSYANGFMRTIVDVVQQTFDLIYDFPAYMAYL